MAKRKIARGSVRRLLIVIGRLQNLIGGAEGHHENDRDPNGFARGQIKLREAFRLCVETTDEYEPVEETPNVND